MRKDNEEDRENCSESGGRGVTVATTEGKAKEIVIKKEKQQQQQEREQGERKPGLRGSKRNTKGKSREEQRNRSSSNTRTRSNNKKKIRRKSCKIIQEVKDKVKHYRGKVT